MIHFQVVTFKLHTSGLEFDPVEIAGFCIAAINITSLSFGINVFTVVFKEETWLHHLRYYLLNPINMSK